MCIASKNHIFAPGCSSRLTGPPTMTFAGRSIQERVGVTPPRSYHRQVGYVVKNDNWSEGAEPPLAQPRGMRISCVGRGRSEKKCPLSVCVRAEAPPPKSGFSRKSGFRFRRTVQQTGAFLQTALSMKRYCAISFQRPLYEPLIRIFRRPVMVLRVSLLRDTFTFIPVSPKMLYICDHDLVVV